MPDAGWGRCRIFRIIDSHPLGVLSQSARCAPPLAFAGFLRPAAVAEWPQAPRVMPSERCVRFTPAAPVSSVGTLPSHGFSTPYNRRSDSHADCTWRSFRGWAQGAGRSFCGGGIDRRAPGTSPARTPAVASTNSRSCCSYSSRPDPLSVGRRDRPRACSSPRTFGMDHSLRSSPNAVCGARGVDIRVGARGRYRAPRIRNIFTHTAVAHRQSAPMLPGRRRGRWLDSIPRYHFGTFFVSPFPRFGTNKGTDRRGAAC